MTEHVADPRWERENLPDTMTVADLTDYMVDAYQIDIAPGKFQAAMKQAVAGFAMAIFSSWQDPETLPTQIALGQALATHDKTVALFNAITDDRVGRA